MTQSTSSATPYAEAAHVYRELGWRGVLPVDLNGRPGHVPTGYSGHGGGDPDDDQVARWVNTHADHNVGLRLPDDVLGIDVDAYDGKRGAESVTYVAEQLDAGDLPPTWTSTARGPGQPSRIHLYRVPAGGRWRSDLGRGSGVEVIQRGHRWARVWPSRNHRLLGRDVDPTYRWYRPDGTESDRPPRPEELAELPEPWLAVLRDDATASAPGADRTRDGGDHRHDDVPVVDQDGQPVDPDLVLDHGLPIGAQQNELFRYMCSLRARNLRRSEMLVLGMVALQRMANDPGREPWTAQHVTELVDRVRREYAPGASVALPAHLRDWAASVGGVTSVDEPPPAVESATDLGNSLRFARLFRDRARYAEDVQRWYVWDGRRWAPDAQGLRVVELTKHVIDDLRREALGADGEDRNRWLQWANQSESLPRREATVRGARSEPGITVTSEVFDGDPDLLVVRNGTIDLRTGELRASEPGDLCSHLAEVDWDADASHERWSGHVALLCKNDPELMTYLARAVGYSLTGDVGARSFFFLEGTGSNGKNAFIEPIMQLMGSYAQTASPSLLTGVEGKQHEAVVADLLGARLVFVDETRRDKPLNVERIKALTGSKRIKANFMRQNFFEFEARFKLWIAGNGTPKLKDDSDGVWKRLHRVVCHGKVADDQRIDRFGDVLYEEESSGILNWALAGLADYRRRRGLAVPETVKADVANFRHDENYELQFLEDRLVVTGDAVDVITNEDMWRWYNEWCQASGIRGAEIKTAITLSKSIVGFELPGVTRFHGRVDGQVRRGFAGLRWRRDEDD